MSPWIKRKHDKKSLAIIVLSILLFISLAANLYLLKLLRSTKKTVARQQQQVIAAIEEPVNASSEVAGKWYGLCSKNSIHSVNDFYRTVHDDPLLAAHFADFDWAKARMGTLENSLWTYVTYRKNGKIATTRRQIILPKGDGYITDGRRQIRTYCCNDYVAAATPPTDDEGRERVEGPPRPEEPVPEPATVLLFGAGLASLGLVRWLRGRNQSR